MGSDGKALIALLALLGLTLALHFLKLGWFSPVASMAVAGVKAALVALFFMELRTAAPESRLFAAAGLVWLVILLGLTLTDYVSRS